jgi:spermidine synthase
LLLSLEKKKQKTFGSTAVSALRLGRQREAKFAMTDVWLNETLYADWGQRFRVVRELARVKSAFQDIVVFESASHGRVMVLDGCIQITERDEFIYQEMIAHVPLLAHGAVRNVLIIGAGDGGVLRRVLAHRGVERAVMVEIDGDVVRLAKEFLPSIAGGAWDDSRAEVIIGDGIEYVRNARAAAFDAIIVDSTDPIGVGEALFTDAFYQNCERVLSPAGLVVNQCGVPFMQADELRETSARRRRFFPHVSAYVAAVPTYVGGLMTLGIAAKDGAALARDAETVRARADAAGVLGTTGYWSPEVHEASFHLPPYIARNLPA